MPAVGQGALSIECRGDDQELLEWLEKFTSARTAAAVRAERSFLAKMEGGCQVPIAGFAEAGESGKITLTVLVGSPDGKVIYKDTVSGTDPESLGELAADRLIAQGASELIKEVKEGLEME